MTGFGEQLRFQREQLGVSIESLCAATKVQQRHLLALEQEDYRALPGGVFRRGIVRAYLTAAGLDETTWMPRFEQSYHEQARRLGLESPSDSAAWATFAENVKRNRVPVAQSNSLRWLGVLALLLALLAGAWALWHYVLRFRIATP